MTEEEAKTKWCPFARLTKSSVGLINNRGTWWSDDSNHCIGRQCMAWRKGEDRKLFEYTEQTPLIVHTGYCGLAGKP